MLNLGIGRIGLILILSSLNPSFLFASPDFPSFIPNGQVNSCLNCHVEPQPVVPNLNPFGLDYQESLEWNSQLAEKDSDQDGIPNGIELQDPNGAWKKGDSQPGKVKFVSNPGDATSIPSKVKVKPRDANSSRSKTKVVWGPFLTDLEPTSVCINWRTNTATDSIIELAPAEGKYKLYKSELTEKLKVDQVDQVDQVDRIVDRRTSEWHSYRITGLSPATQYIYRIGFTESGKVKYDGYYTLKTSVRGDEPFVFAAYGDTRTNSQDHQAVVDSIIAAKPDFVIHTGDLVSDGRSYDQWDTFFKTVKKLYSFVPLFPSLGNHDKNADYYYNFFVLPKGGGKCGEQWYSFDYGKAHFVALDSCYREGNLQDRWLENDLAMAKGNYDWIFVYFHHPPFSSGSHGSDLDIRERWVEIFEKYGVDVVFSGHDHVYERSKVNGIYCITTGGGGAPKHKVGIKPNPASLYAESTLHFCKVSIDGRKLKLEMIRPDGSVGDSFSIEKLSIAQTETQHTLQLRSILTE